MICLAAPIATIIADNTADQLPQNRGDLQSLVDELLPRISSINLAL